MLMDDFFKAVLGNKAQGALKVVLSKGKNPEFMIFSDNKKLLQDFSDEASRYLKDQNNQPAHLRVWTVDSSVPYINDLGEVSNFTNHQEDSEYNIAMGKEHVEKICRGLNLKFNATAIVKELIKNKNVLPDAGHTGEGLYKVNFDQPQISNNNNATNTTQQNEIEQEEPLKLEPVPEKTVTLEQFKTAYMKKYKGEFFKNPWSTMKNELKKLDENDPNDPSKIKSMEDVEKHTGKRTVEVLKSLKK